MGEGGLALGFGKGGGLEREMYLLPSCGERGKGERERTLHDALYGLRVGEDLEGVFWRLCSARRIHCRRSRFAVNCNVACVFR